MLGIIQKVSTEASPELPLLKRKSFCVGEDDGAKNMLSKCRRLSLSAGRRLSLSAHEGDKMVQGEEEIIVGPYSIGTPISINEKNRVHLAHHTVTEELVVVKMCAHSNDSSNQNRLRLEYDIGSKLDHPNISKYLDLIETENDICIFMEYCGSETLEALLKNVKCLEESQARHFFTQLISALQYCHERKVYHGDIKLSNILVYNGNVKLIDFDASKANNSERTTFCGTIAFMSPEIILQTSYNGGPSDIWSAGVCLHVMVSGNYPFNSLAETLEGKYTNPANASPLCSDLLRSILQLNPELRPSPKVILDHPWVTASTTTRSAN